MRDYLSRMLICFCDRMYSLALWIRKDRVREEGLLRYPECLIISSKAQAMKNLSDRLEDYIERKKLYLDPFMSLSKVASLVGSNRTYISNILASKNGFKSYLNEQRFKYIFQQIADLPANQAGILRDGDTRLDSTEYAFIILRSGFSDLRTFRRQLSVINGEWASRLRSILY
jgi:AraC-like DNA-binding protein